MPIYEYVCDACEHQLDALQKVSDAPLTECPVCGKPALRRLISAPRFRLKGGGWYETDFKDGARRNIAQSDSKPDKPEPAKAKAGTAGDKAKPAKKDTASKPKADAKPASSKASS